MKKEFRVFLISAMLIFMTSCGKITSVEKYYNAEKVDEFGKATISVDCSDVLYNMSKLDKGLENFIPENGIIVKESKQAFEEGDTPYDVLVRALKKEKIHMESKGSFGKKEIEGICYLYNTSCGSSSRWIYKINGEIQQPVCSEYEVRDGDKIEWIYVCDSEE